MNRSDASRSPYWDILKGIGIIFIVLGHSCHFAVGFVYLFHLALFFFVSGYLYREEKYGDAPFLYFGSRLKGAWPRYFFYTSCFVLLHNFFVTRGLYAGQEIYNHTRMLAQICTNISFTGTEPVQGALWFIPAWLASSGMFAGCVWFGRTISSRLGMPGLKVALIGLASFAPGLAGIFLCMRKVGLPFNFHAAFAVVPLYFFAYLMRCFFPSFRKFTTWYTALISGVLLWFINAKLGVYILLDGMVLPGLWFYPISLLGIWFCLSLGALAEKTGALSRLLAFLGRYSFEIMALHFTVFKLVDLAYARLILHAVPENLAGFPIAFSAELWPVYLLAGTLIPAFVGFLIDRLIRFGDGLPSLSE